MVVALPERNTGDLAIVITAYTGIKPGKARRYRIRTQAKWNAGARRAELQTSRRRSTGRSGGAIAIAGYSLVQAVVEYSASVAGHGEGFFFFFSLALDF